MHINTVVIKKERVKLGVISASFLILILSYSKLPQVSPTISYKVAEEFQLRAGFLTSSASTLLMSFVYRENIKPEFWPILVNKNAFFSDRENFLYINKFM